jgi:riboflavin synthase alpha subunit
MAGPTNQELLEATRTAILEIVQTGQSISADGRSLTMANLSELRKLEAELKVEVAAAAKAGRNRLLYVRPVG